MALGAFLACVFYLDLGGGRVGDALASGALASLGAAAYATPVILFGVGAILVLGPVLPSVRPFRSGAACLLAALTLGLAGGLFGLGPEQPARDRTSRTPASSPTMAASWARRCTGSPARSRATWAPTSSSSSCSSPGSSC